jgi:CRP/FNR family transcriptional regulator
VLNKHLYINKEINWLYTKKNNSYTSVIKKSPLREILNQSAAKTFYTVRKNDYLFHENQPASGVFFIMSGKVKIIRNEKLHYPAILYLVKPGDVLGMHAIIDDHPHTNSAAALVNTDICFIPKDESLQIVAGSHKNKMIVMQQLCSRIDHIESRINSRSDKSATERFAELLLLLAETYGITDKNTLKVELNLEELASLAGTSKGYLSKIIGDFSQKDIILFKNNGIRILNVPDLKQIAKV